MKGLDAINHARLFLADAAARHKKASAAAVAIDAKSMTEMLAEIQAIDKQADEDRELARKRAGVCVAAARAELVTAASELAKVYGKARIRLLKSYPELETLTTDKGSKE